MEYRHYEQKDEAAVIDLWNKTLIFDLVDEKKFRRQAILDENFDDQLSWVAFDEKERKIVGFIYAIKRKFPYLERGLEPELGWINVIFVNKDYQRQGIGSHLLKLAEESLKNFGVKKIIPASYSPNYFFWGIDKENYEAAYKFFEHHGYTSTEEHYSMGRNLHGYKIPDKIKQKQKEAEKQGYRFINFDYSYTLDLLNFLKAEFGGGWKRNALIAMQENIAEDVLTLVVDKDNKICGCCNRAIDKNPMRIGPIGIAESKRNSGIGTILFCYTINEMAKKGIYHVYFVTTNKDGRRYYERLGLEIIRTSTDYMKEL